MGMVQRKQYRRRQEGKHSHLTNDRLKKRNRIGFVWNEYDKYIKGETFNTDKAKIEDLGSIGFFDVYGK